MHPAPVCRARVSPYLERERVAAKNAGILLPPNRGGKFIGSSDKMCLWIKLSCTKEGLKSRKVIAGGRRNGKKKAQNSLH